MVRLIMFDESETAGSPLIGANFDDNPAATNLILRRPRSGRLEGWATDGILEKAFSERLRCCPPFETAAARPPQGEVRA